MKQYLNHIFHCLIWFSSLHVYAAKPIDTNAEKINLVENSPITLVNRNFSFQLPEDSLKWKELGKQSLFFNSERDAYLLKVELTQTIASSTFVISCENPNTDHFEIFEKSNLGTYSIHKSGDIYPWVQRDLKEAYPSYRISLNKGETKTFYIKVFMDEEGLIPVHLYSLTTYYKGFAQRELFFGLFVGIMMLMAFFNLFLYLLTKNKLQLHCFLYIISISLAQTSLFGNSLGHFYFFSIFLSKYDAIIFASLLGPVAILFILKYFEFGKTGIFHRIFKGFVLLFILIPIYAIITNNIAQAFQTLNIVFLFSYFIAYGIMITSIKYNKFLTISFIAAWTILLIGGFVFVGINLGVVKYSQFKLYLTPLGAIIETFLLSFVLGYNINQLKETKAISELNLLKKNEENRMLAIEKKEMELHALKSQMNPHFIFNALSSIQFYILKNKVDSAITYIGNFGKLIRNSFSFADKKSITLSEEIGFLEQYLNLEKIRLPDLFEFVIKVDPELDANHVEIPPFIIQPMVENATKHAFSGIDYPGKLEISFHKVIQELVIHVEDNGIGLNVNPTLKQHKSKGIAITKKRLHIIQASNKLNRKATLQIIDKKSIEEGRGVRAIITIPLNFLKKR